MLDFDLAELYGVETRALNQAVKRNREGFPDDFMFQLNREEFSRLDITNCGHQVGEELASLFVALRPSRFFISCQKKSKVKSYSVSLV